MQIIVVSDRFSTAKSLTVTTWHMVLAGVLTLGAVIGLSSLFSYLALRHAADLKIPFLNEAIAFVQQEQNKKTEDFVRDNLKAIATKVGQLQAQMLHLDSLGDRLSAVTGVKPSDLNAAATAPKNGGQGGPIVTSSLYRLSAEEVGREVDQMLRKAEEQNDYLAVVETTLMEQRIQRKRLPTMLPVDANWSASAFGWRADPFTGQRAMHEGVDFSAEVGTPIMSAANGMVIAAGSHPEYGLLLEVDHGQDYTSRYAHASKLLVKEGQIVKRGQKIAEVGNTGRSTGPHLHFEVRHKGVALNPAKFLPRAGDTSVAMQLKQHRKN